jgi:hypothetical protein
VNNAYVVVPGYSCPINVTQETARIAVPSGTEWVRVSLVSSQLMRLRPQFSARLQILWTDTNNRTPIRRDFWEEKPRPAWTPEELQEGLPVAGHAAGSPPGIVPHDVGPFEYIVEGSPAVNQLFVDRNPPGYDRLYAEYTIFGGNNGGPVYCSVVVEALKMDGTPLEFA